MMRAGIAKLLLPLALAAAVAPGCATNPVTGNLELSLISEQQEKALGAEADAQLVADTGVIEDAALAEYVASVGRTMVPVSHRPDLGYAFRVLDDPQVNAFALPGGYVYVTRGILAYLDSEAALAGVLGHEIGHVTAKHGVKRYSQQVLLGIGLQLAGSLGDALEEYVGVAGVAAQLLLLKYSRDQERQSDQLGVEYASELGYDTRDMAGFFDTLARLSPAGGRLPAWVSTHPEPDERRETILQLTAEAQRGAAGPFTTGRDDFLRRLDGLAYGYDPQRGFLQDGRLQHPGLGVSFPVPEGWDVSAGQDRIDMASPAGNAAVIFQREPEAELEQAAARFTGQQGLAVLEQQTASTAVGPGLRAVCSATSQSGGELRVVSLFIQRPGGVVVAFHGVCTAPELAALSPELEAPATGVAEITDPAILGVRSPVLKVIRVPAATTFANALRAWPIPEEAGLDLAGLALMNGVAGPDAGIEAGTLLKVLVPGR
jgi:predicted Zn-dependent protease